MPRAKLIDGKKACSVCKVIKSLDEYSPGNAIGGRHAQCKQCKKTKEQNRRRMNGAKPKTFSKIEGNKKLCMNCKTMKPLEDFSKSKRGKGGLAAYCKPCFADRFYDSDRYSEGAKKYRKRNRFRWLALHRIHQHERRTKIKVTCDGTVTNEFLKALYETEECVYCEKYTPENKRTADHVESLAKGGTHSASNLVMACHDCNSRKRDMTAEEFKEKLNVDKC